MANETIEINPIVEAWFSDSIDLVIGLLLGIMTVAGVILNSCVFGMFVKYRKEMKSRTTYMIISLALSDGLMAAIGGLMYTISSLNHKWAFGYSGCVFYGVVMFTTGCADIAHLSAIAIDRALAIGTPIKYKAWAQKPILTATPIALSWLYGFLWAALPLTGVSEYTYEGKTSCSVNWMRQDMASRAYIGFIFFACYFLPVAAMLGSYGYIILAVKALRHKVAGDDTAASRKKKDSEVKMATNFALLMIVYMLAWTPYTVVSMMGVYGDASIIPHAARGVPAVLTKFSFLSNPLLYVFPNKHHRQKMKSFLGLANMVGVVPTSQKTTTEDVDKKPAADTTKGDNRDNAEVAGTSTVV